MSTKYQYRGPLEAFLQTDSRTCDGCVESALRRNWDHLLSFKQVALDKNNLYVYSLIGLHEQFYNKLLLPESLKLVTIISSLCLSSFPFHLSTLPRIAITSLIYLSMVRSISSGPNCKGTFLTRHT